MARDRKRLTIAEIAAKAQPILTHYGVRWAAVFGSAARGELRARSDIDILVDFVAPIGLFRFVGLKLDLEDALNRKVDLVSYGAIKPTLRERILREAIPIA